MSQSTKIEWTDRVWNPLRGCARVSEGCRNCYAERVAMRFNGEDQPYHKLVKMTSQGPKWTGKVRTLPEALAIPFGWAKPRMVFVNSMSDPFHESVSFEFIASVFAVMSVTSRHTYQVLTKRPERMLQFFEWVKEGGGIFDDDRISDAIRSAHIPWKPQHDKRRGGYDNCGPGFPYENVWLGVSVEDQKTADERIPLLLQCPAAVRWISAEPLLGPIDMTGEYLSTRCGGQYPFPTLPDEHRTKIIERLDWIVVGGESGPGARPMHPDWAADIRDQCAEAGVPFFFKQWGEWAPGENIERHAGIVKTADWFAGDWMFGDTDLSSDGGHIDDESDLYRVGKKYTGRHLDGRTHDEFPEAR
jgi:protein gp37